MHCISICVCIWLYPLLVYELGNFVNFSNPPFPILGSHAHFKLLDTYILYVCGMFSIDLLLLDPVPSHTS